MPLLLSKSGIRKKKKKKKPCRGKGKVVQMSFIHLQTLPKAPVIQTQEWERLTDEYLLNTLEVYTLFTKEDFLKISFEGKTLLNWEILRNQQNKGAWSLPSSVNCKYCVPEAGTMKENCKPSQSY